jgi:predicted enzyme related to lactoylglutathione lyase
LNSVGSFTTGFGRTFGSSPTAYRAAHPQGVEFAQEPTEQPYGIDAGFRDPSGNHFRMAQMR